MIQMKDMLNLFPKTPLYFNFPSKHAKEKCLNADFLTAGRLLQKKCLVVYYSSSTLKDYIKLPSGGRVLEERQGHGGEYHGQTCRRLLQAYRAHV